MLLVGAVTALPVLASFDANIPDIGVDIPAIITKALTAFGLVLAAAITASAAIFVLMAGWALGKRLIRAR
jgi:hypothetical protein